jgi:hypothetical protein
MSIIQKYKKLISKRKKLLYKRSNLLYGLRVETQARKRNKRSCNLRQQTILKAGLKESDKINYINNLIQTRTILIKNAMDSLKKNKAKIKKINIELSNLV